MEQSTANIDLGKASIKNYLEQAMLFIWGIVFLLFPLVFSTLTTESFNLPKEIFLGAVVLVSFILLSVKIMVEGKINIRRTPFDGPLFIFLLAVFASALFAVDRYDSLSAFVSLLFIVGSYFVVVNIATSKHSLLFLVNSLLVGASAAGLVGVLSYFKIYVLPFQITHAQTFSTFGQQAFYACIYIGVTLSVAASFLIQLVKKKNFHTQTIIFAVTTALLTLSFLFFVWQTFTAQKPIILSFETGFQTAFAAISQDGSRILQGFFFGTGYGNYVVDFTKFKLAGFNNNPLWYVTFFSSSSYVLELIATTGIFGIGTFIFLTIKILQNAKKKMENPLFIPLLIILGAACLLPFSFLNLALFFFLLALLSLGGINKADDGFFDLEMKFITLRKSLFSFFGSNPNATYQKNRIIPIIVACLVLVGVGIVGYFSVTFAYANMIFQRSVVATSKNNGQQTYTLQTKAISIFPYNSDYYRIFSQTNISLANSLFALQPKGSSPSAQVQQTAFALVQQAISTARNATTLSPDLVANWQNLASLYRTLIGFGQNAENFAISSMQQAIAVDPTNPQEYINLGGIYYQLGQYDNAIHQFETAITLKQDLANAYYNLGHAYEQKGDLQNALIQYKNVKILVVNDKANTTRIDQEIKIIEGKIGEQNTNQKTIPQAVTPKQPAAQSQPLNINGQESQQAGQAATPTITQENVNPTAPQVPVSPSPTNPTP